MALPATRAEFKAYCLRNLGAGVVKVNVSDDQVEDRIDEAFLYWHDYGYSALEKTYYKYAITQTDFDNKYITLPQNIVGAVRIFDLTNVSSAIENPFNIQYQMMMNDLYALSGVTMIPYYITFQHLQFIQQLLIGQVPVRYNRHTNQLWLDMDWTRLAIGNFVIVEAYQTVDPTTYPDVWGDRQLLKYASALIKRQYATNLKKYGNMEMPGGITFNAQQMYDEAVDEIKECEQEMRESSLPACDMIG